MKEYILKDILLERKEYSEKGKDYKHVTLSKEGIKDKTERYDRDFLVKDENKKYKITHLNDICYNPANLKFGVICLNSYGDAIFSPIYVTFELRKEIKEEINIEYLSYILTSRDFIEKSRKYEQGTVYERMSVNPSDFLRMKVKIPSMLEQEQIVKAFKIVNKLINNCKNNFLQKDRLIEAEFNKLFGNPIKNEKKWDKKILGDLGELKNGMNFNRSEKGTKVKFLSVGDFNNGIIINDIGQLQYIELNNMPSEEYLLKAGDIVFVRSNGSKSLVGRSVLLNSITEETTYSGFCIRYRNNNKLVNEKFLIYLFKNKCFFQYLKKESGGTNINNINQQVLSKMKIIMPDKETQDKFDVVVNNLEKQKLLLKMQIDNYTKLNNYLRKKIV